MASAILGVLIVTLFVFVGVAVTARIVLSD